VMQTQYTYDALGRAATITRGSGTFALQYPGDDAPYPSRVTLPSGVTVDTAHDGALRFVSLTITRPGATSPLVQSTSYLCDGRTDRWTVNGIDTSTSQCGGGGLGGSL
jgi:hypothetical protein